MPNLESDFERLSEKMALKAYVIKWLWMPNRDRGFEHLTKKFVLSAS